MSKRKNQFALLLLLLLTTISHAQSFSNLRISAAAGYNAYTISSSIQYTKKWTLDVGYQTNDSHFRVSETYGDFDPFTDRFFGSLLRSFPQSEKLTHYAGLGAISTSSAIPLAGTIRYQLTYFLTDKLALNSNVYLIFSKPSEVNVGLTYTIL